MFQPTFFSDELKNYPLDWSNVTPYTFDEIEENDPESIVDVKETGYLTTESHITYYSTEFRT